ncbi:hypothetical protein [Pseudomonas sp. UFMG81]|jgi:hypothetical protein|uniref:hypothetical protein n=1 Tax=Pseudomonas sp. UFMG81 TaxID=2745936 RepID=UPI00188F827E|nr:hypothetical protein [Pseudomonas sp. UFMG81]
MRHRITAICHKASFSLSTCAWLAIDDVPIEVWLAQHLDEPDLALNGLALMWLLDEQEDALANRRIVPAADGTSTLVPLLVCSDDMDFDCFALMTEQVVEGDTVHWRRFGHSATGGLEVGVSTHWYAGSKPVSFALSDFNQALSEHKRLIKACVGSEG